MGFVILRLMPKDLISKRFFATLRMTGSYQKREFFLSFLFTHSLRRLSAVFISLGGVFCDFFINPCKIIIVLFLNVAYKILMFSCPNILISHRGVPVSFLI